VSTDTRYPILMDDLDAWEATASPILAADLPVILGGQLFAEADATDDGPAYWDLPESSLGLALVGCSAQGRSAHLVG
jgi:hypothetical protein